MEVLYQPPNNNVNIGMTGGEVNFIGNISEGVAGAIGTSTAGGKADLQKLFVGPNVIFQNNESTSGRFMTDPTDIALHESHIQATVFTLPFQYGYNDFDIQYSEGTPAVIYTVSFEAPGQEFNSQRVPEGGTALNPTPVAGCDVYGTIWYADETHTIPWDFTNPIEGNTTLYGEEGFLSCATHEVRFNANGGSAVPAQTVETGQPAAEPEPPTRGCDIFGGWYLDAALTMPYDFEMPVDVNMTLFARWIPNACPGAQNQVTFNTNGGTTVAPAVVPEGSTVAEPEAPSRGCDIFAGWYEDEELTIPYNFENPVNAPLTLYAAWIPNACPEGQNLIQFDTNGGELLAPQVVEDGGTVIQPPDPIRGCDIFAGWYLDEELTIPYDFSAPVGGPLTLYADWIPNACPGYQVSFNSNGGSAVATQTVASGEMASEPAPPTRGCDVFAGWYTNPALTILYDFNTPVTAPITLYARWIPTACPPGQHQVTFNSNGGTAVAPQVVANGEMASEPAPPTRGCDVFAGWYTNPALTIPYDFNTPVTAPVTLYARWIPTACPPGQNQVSFNTNGGSNVPPQVVATGETAAKPPNPTRGCDIFAGWYANAALTIPYDFGTPVTGPVTLYARWIPNACPPGGPVGVTLTARKRLCGGACLRAGMFGFAVYDQLGNEAARAANNGCGLVVFPRIMFQQVGTYQYTIRELGRTGSPSFRSKQASNPCGVRERGLFG